MGKIQEHLFGSPKCEGHSEKGNLGNHALKIAYFTNVNMHLCDMAKGNYWVINR
ncbi:hypothetical protein SAMN05216570_0956 [Dyella sp. OK004]|nr:hypothetical protein SAMN05216570_0956 [Dyella sp. OK004]